MKQITLSFITILFLSSNLISQSFGLRTGVNLANLTGDIENNTSIVAYQVGPFAEFNIGANVDLNLAILYSKKGTKDQLFDFTSNYHYLEVPMLLRYNIAVLFLEIGPYGSYVISADTAGEDIGEFIKDGDFGLIFGAGVCIGNIKFDARYSFGLADINDIGVEEIKHSVITFGAEFKF